MFEIELKAHVKNHEETLKKLHEISEFVHYVNKSDTYYHLEKTSSNVSDRNYISTRIRKVTELSSSDRFEKFYLTYKQKELRTETDGTQIEVNDEKECELSDPKAIEALLKDSGFKVVLQKTKIVHGFKTLTEFGDCNLELCTVPPLGDFLEIEILSRNDDPSTVKSIFEKIKNYFTLCGLSESDIEGRYYSEMLKEYQKNLTETSK